MMVAVEDVVVATLPTADQKQHLAEEAELAVEAAAKYQTAGSAAAAMEAAD